MSSDRMSAQKFVDKVAKNLKKATMSALKDSISAMKKEIGRVGDFKGRSLESLVKIRIGKSDNPTAYVRVAFGDKQQSTKRIIILLPQGKRLGLPRVGNQWKAIYNKFKSKFKIVRSGSGYIVLFSDRGQIVPVYKIQRVFIKRVPLRQIGDRISSQISEKISNYKGKYE